MSDGARRLVYQSSYTGMKNDLLWAFAKNVWLCNADLTDFENLLAAGDQSIYAWVTGNEQVPNAYDTAI